jgi:hypothetical protein
MNADHHNEISLTADIVNIVYVTRYTDSNTMNSAQYTRSIKETVATTQPINAALSLIKIALCRHIRVYEAKVVGFIFKAEIFMHEPCY